MFGKILIANRGEIACRIMATCRRLGIATVAVYSDADRRSRHLRHADEAVRIGPAPANRSYLDIDRIVDAAQTTGADAIHPGYGFLSENAKFVAACEASGITFIGPRADTMISMGAKDQSKKLMQRAGIPVVPGYHGDDQDDHNLKTEADRIEYPLMIKACAGGGGKGMRIVNSAGEFQEALAGARREAQNSFADDSVLLEKYITRPRHIEYQVFGDKHGNIVHLNERECSIQRRYQKIIEETPSPYLDDQQRVRMGETAVAAAHAVNYLNAGTVEFIVDENHDFYFMEMNTRLQVEHPVTELTSGLDLVEWQIKVAAGEALPLSQDQITSQGSAIEVRIYAENPRNEFLPSTGNIDAFFYPESPDVRLDSGVESGDSVSVHYDPMIAKLCVHAADRDTALQTLGHALARTDVFGPVTNIDLLRRIAASTSFANGNIDTGYIDTHLEELLPEPAFDRSALIAAAVRWLRQKQLDRAVNCAVQDKDGISPWATDDGWRLNATGWINLSFSVGNENHIISISDQGDRSDAGDRYRCLIEGTEYAVIVEHDATVVLKIKIDEQTYSFETRVDDPCYLFSVDNTAFALRRVARYPVSTHVSDEEAHPGSPLPGRIVSIEVAEGDHVDEGQALLVLEGMKMEFTLRAKCAGVVEKLLYDKGDIVEAETPLVDIRSDEAEE